MNVLLASPRIECKVVSASCTQAHASLFFILLHFTINNGIEANTPFMPPPPNQLNPGSTQFFMPKHQFCGTKSFHTSTMTSIRYMDFTFDINKLYMVLIIFQPSTHVNVLNSIFTCWQKILLIYHK